MPRREFVQHRNNKVRQLKAKLSQAKGHYKEALKREELLRAYHFQVQMRVIEEFLEAM